MCQHELIDFLRAANNDIEREYDLISRRVIEDPGTAGDQGEENWKCILEKWLPSYFHIVTKGRIIGVNGNTSPQMDIIVLSPEYPPDLLKYKLYLASGVVAAFECKTTLERKHIEKFMNTSKVLTDLTMRDSSCLRKELKRKIYYGLLAHSHCWKSKKSKPILNIRKALIDYDNRIIEHPIELPDLVCVADLATWLCRKIVVPDQEKGNYFSVRSTFVVNNKPKDHYTAVGTMLFNVLEYLAWDYKGLRDIVNYMRLLHVEGEASGKTRIWPESVLTAQTRNNLNRYNNSGLWNEWSWYVR